jgi:predicted nucleotidyltransferase
MSTLHLEPRHLAMLQAILKGHEGAYVFGSRVKGNHKKFSDIDLCFVREVPMDLSEMGKLRFAFEESDLPFKVDIVDYQRVTPEFRAIIDREKVPFPYGDVV